MNQNQDFELINKFSKGDETAFNELVRKYQTKIYWHARRMLGSHMDADEVTQEVLLVLYKKLKNFNFNSSFYTWLYKIVTTRSINLLNRRKVKRFVFINDTESQILESESDITADIDNREKLERLDKILTKLPVKQREVFVLRHFEELSYKEISEIKGKSVGGLKANYFHALKKVMELMGNE
ncbi:MAG: RNA polymerase subunit sigma-70 [Ignavibacteria bacterium RBG_13_36_8]|nr:MAG: RNA polymerase subunit sigma-70 [Ignavibacteria bacterium RBG_13_36_8]